MRVRFYAIGREIAGTNEHVSGAENTAELRADLVTSYGDRMGQLFDASSLLFDGRRVGSDSNARFRDNDVVDLLPPFAGG